jgi:hypothetical protein
MAKEHVLKYCDSKMNTDKFWDIVRSEVARTDMYYSQDQSKVDKFMSGKMISESIRDRKTLSWNDVLKISVPVYSGSPAILSGDLYRLMLRIGFKDDFDSHLPVLTRD